MSEYSITNNNKAFTMVEILVVVAIILVLFAVLFPVVYRVKIKSQDAVCLSNLHQSGLAINLYYADYDAYPLSVSNLDGGYIKDHNILLCPLDTTGNRGGLINRFDADNKDTGNPPVKHSYSYALDTASKAFWEKGYAVNGESTGLMVCQTHGEKTPEFEGNSQPNEGSYEGLVLRLRRDGAVVRRNIHWKRTFDPLHFRSDLQADSQLLYMDTPILWP